ncbi:hypothetical protein BC830DRAFT_1171011 [Chytriomyces sp. MP71]|nr:hypothetical protein BC830DRAFT_1171011 [Chytriomyces sp. MP71]
MKTKRNLLIGCTGSVASLKIPALVEAIQSHPDWDVSIKVIATAHALHFFDRAHTESRGVPVLTEEDEWKTWTKKTDPVLHIDLRNWADAILVAPLDANTLGKLANGLCDNLLTCILRAWDATKPVLIAPAMNTHMWNHPLTAMHLNFVSKTLQYEVTPPISKLLACGDTGVGAMAEVSDLVLKLEAAFARDQCEAYISI